MQRREFLHFLISITGAVLLPLILFFAYPQFSGLPRLFSLSEGIWQTQAPTLQRLILKGLKSPVDIAFDSQGIPHILAQNDEDVFFAQGFLTAYYRLFEMDINTRVAPGRLSEMLGERGLEYDRFFVSFGMRQAMKEEADALMADPEEGPVIQAYIKGVNAYIHTLSYRDLPVEYKILGVWPEDWTPERVAALLKIMTFRLNGRSQDLRLTRVLQSLGAEKTADLFPEFLPANLEAYFIEPQGERKRSLEPKLSSNVHLNQFPSFLSIFEANGSNSWAVGPSKSKTGKSILANDTHLGLQVPSVWFEMQILSPNMNVYGATFPGAPGIILGLNPKLAWGVTNGTVDAIDWNEVEFKDEQALEYKFDSAFKKAVVMDEQIHIKDRPAVIVPVVKTDYGYILHREKKYGLSVRWVGHSVSHELKSLLHLNRSKSIADCIQSLKFWQQPVQNFTCADEDNISIYQAGRIPKRANYRGWVVDSAIGQESLWAGDIPFEELPHSVNPTNGFVFSANQRPVGPSYPYYLSWDFEEPFRGQRIRTLLTDKQKLDGPELMQIQNDVRDQHASIALPILLQLTKAKDFNEDQAKLFQQLKQWDYLVHAKAIEASLFRGWWDKIEGLLWKDLELGNPKRFVPKKARTIWFLRQVQSSPAKWKQYVAGFNAPEDLITEAFKLMVDDFRKRYGSNSENWNWEDVQKTVATHVAHFPGFDSENISMDGDAYCVQANKGLHGPAWKFVAEMGPRPRVWTQFPGGVTGNPLDPDYTKFLEPWSRGEMRSSEFWLDAHEAMGNASYVWRWEQR